MVRPEVKKRRQELAAKAIQSRKNRKKLEKIVLHKKLKGERAKILDDLQKCQLQPEQLDLFHSTSSMQTKGLKRFMTGDSETNYTKVDNIARAEQCLDAASLIKRKRRKIKKTKLESSTSSSSEDTDAISTDTEIYWDLEQEDQLVKKAKSDSTNGTSEKPTKPQNEVGRLATPETKPKTVTVSEKLCINDLSKKPIKLEQPREPAVYVQVNRSEEVEKARLELPIIGEEQSIMENIRYNDVVILSGETGSGKTTQVPQFLYEAGYTLNGKMIGITEPRRVAAVSMSERVAHELNLATDQVSYQIRFSGNVVKSTQIKFMTDGVLLRECQQDFLLSKYSVLIIDEAHERSIFSDILIGLLSRIVPMRRKRNDPLKLVIMSATLRVKDFTKNSFLFRVPPPVINIEARQFPVSVQFAKKTPPNYLHAAYRKVCSIHSKMPKGGILVFVTSQMDVKVLCRKLREKFPHNRSTTREVKPVKRSKLGKLDLKKSIPSETDPEIKLRTLENLKENLETAGMDEEGDDAFDERPIAFDLDDIDSEESDSGLVHDSDQPLYCLGLFAMLPLEKQRLVFKDPPEGTRLCVIATNVAETSITIPNIKYVIDTGLEKKKVYDLTTGVSKFVTSWTSKSSAEQRMGRAGRMGPGTCFRLYSSAVFTNDLPDYSEPRILQKPVDDVILQMKSMNIDNVVNFPFPTRPSMEALKSAEKKLILLGALDDSRLKMARFQDIAKLEYSSRPTPLGKAMASFAVSARCAKMIVLSPSDLLPHVISLVCGLTVREIYLEGNKWRDIKKKWAGHGQYRQLGDYMVMLRAIMASQSSQCSSKKCLELGLRVKAMLEIDKLARQLTHEVNNNLNHPILLDGPSLKKPSEAHSRVLRQLLLTSHCDHVARKLPNGEITVKCKEDPNKTEKKRLKNAYECMETNSFVYISPESILKGDHPEYVIYKELYQGDKKMYMRDVAVIDPQWLPLYAHKLCTFRKPTFYSDLSMKYDKEIGANVCTRETTYGPLNWPLGILNVPSNLVDN